MALKDLRQRGALLRITLLALSILALIFLSLASWYTGEPTDYRFYYDGWGATIVCSTVAAVRTSSYHRKRRSP